LNSNRYTKEGGNLTGLERRFEVFTAVKTPKFILWVLNLKMEAVHSSETLIST
jgi:hypothetical protein